MVFQALVTKQPVKYSHTINKLQRTELNMTTFVEILVEEVIEKQCFFHLQVLEVSTM